MGPPPSRSFLGGVARITFKEAVAKQSLLRHNKISLDGRSCKIFADRRLVWVREKGEKIGLLIPSMVNM